MCPRYQDHCPLLPRPTHLPLFSVACKAFSDPPSTWQPAFLSEGCIVRTSSFPFTQMHALTSFHSVKLTPPASQSSPWFSSQNPVPFSHSSLPETCPLSGCTMAPGSPKSPRECPSAKACGSALRLQSIGKGLPPAHDLCESLSTKPHGPCVCQSSPVQFLSLNGFSETAQQSCLAPGVSADNLPFHCG